MCPLVLLLVLVVGSCCGQNGEYCHGWTDNYGGWHSGFLCPERYDPSEATYCCGSCSLRYCCTAGESRLDQGLCPSESKEEVSREGVSGMDLPAAVPTYLPFLLVGSVFVAFVIVGSLVGLCCCRCLKPEQETQLGGPAPLSRLLDTEPSTDVSRHSSSSSNSAPRGSLGNCPPNLCSLGAENINLYMKMAPSFPVMGCPPNAQFMHNATTAGPFLQPPFINYGMPTEHAIIMAPASYIDVRNCYSQSTNTYLSLPQHHIDPAVPDESPKC
ncbi:protein shisa-1-like [Mixophyes fleayi]|uniref:protein shisa-1-like n=1 Tax=Mixophyes fleayi TaxID=3061075 RepID=UPI003F4E0BB0